MYQNIILAVKNKNNFLLFGSLKLCVFAMKSYVPNPTKLNVANIMQNIKYASRLFVRLEI